MLNQPNLDEYKQQVANFFNARTDYDSSEIAHRRANLLLKFAQLQPGQKILDVATGTGLIAIAAAQIVGDKGKVIGVDIATVLLNQAQQKIANAGLQNIDLIEGDADYLDYSKNSFDVIFCSSAIVCFIDIPTVLNNWYRFLKPGGMVAFHAWDETSMMTPVIMAASARCGVNLPNIHALLGTPEKCKNMLQIAGFQNIEVKTEQMGRYMSITEAKNSWNGKTWLHPQNPLSQLSSEQIEQIKAEFDSQIEALATEKGVWWDITTFFVLARK